MSLPNTVEHAIRWMRFFQRMEERTRSAVTERRHEITEAFKRAYIKTNRQTHGALNQTATQRANQDEVSKTMIGNEQFYRELTSMYANVVIAELAYEEARERDKESNRIRNASASRAE